MYFAASARDDVDTLRLLAQHQGDMDEKNLREFLYHYEGPAEGVDLLISMDMLCIEGDSWLSWLLFRTALGQMGNFPEWESIVRRLLRWGVDPHAHLPWALPDLIFEDEEPNALVNGVFIVTLLDELFGSTDSPVEARMVAQRWLEILKSEGHDVKTYLEKEKTLHGPQLYLTFSRGYYKDETLRQMVFEMETDPPGVYWDWWTDPKSSAALVLEEFKWMNGSCPQSFEGNRVIWVNGSCSQSFAGHRVHWIKSWPFDGLYPSEMDWQQMRDQRWRRNYAKRLARGLARANGNRSYPYSVPGAWPT